MKLAYWMRIALGAGLGAATLVTVWLTLGIGWLTATLSALLALLGFLGSYFVASADRPEEGYEQVLFDRPNTIVSVLLILAFAGAGVATGLLGGPVVATPAENVHALRIQYLSASNAWGKDATQEDTLATLATLREESDRIAIELTSLAEGDARTFLEEANDKLAFAIDSLKGCAEKDSRSCLDARINAADAESALEKYAAVG